MLSDPSSPLHTAQLAPGTDVDVAAVVTSLRRELLRMRSEIEGLQALLSPSWTPSSGLRRQLRLLGDFELTVGGNPIDVPNGNPATLLVLVAVRQRVSISEAIDLLWPEADEATGQGRLRNTLHRLHAVTGKMVLRRNGALELVSGIEVDLHRFYEVAAAVRAARDEPDRSSAARRAYGMYGGMLAPAEGDRDWLVGPRERASRVFVEIVTLLCDQAERDGDLDAAVEFTVVGQAAEPYDERWAIRRAHIVLGRGQRTDALRAAAQATAIIESLGVASTPELDGLLRSCAGSASPVALRRAS